jgi:hypothetical protein
MSQPVQTSGPAATSNVKTNQLSNSAPTSVQVNTLIIAPLIAIGSSIYTPNPSSAHIISSSSLIPGGPAITVSGTVYSLSPGATKFVISPASTNTASSVQAESITLQPTPTHYNTWKTTILHHPHVFISRCHWRNNPNPGRSSRHNQLNA